MTPKAPRSLSIILKALLAGLHAAGSATIFFALSYLLGHAMLDGSLQGSDSPLHIGYAVWLDSYFPHLPHWFPLQGGGVSILHGYPLLAHLEVVVLHRLTGLSILQVFRLLSFLTFPVTALGIYAFSWSALKRKTIGLLAGVLFLLAPVTWTWMYNWGFFAQQMAFVFLPFALLAFERTLHHQLARKVSGRGRLWFAVMIVLLVLSSLFHMLVGASEVMGFALMGLASAITAPQADRRRTLRGGLKVLLTMGVIAGVLLAGYFIPFYAYSRVANRDGLNTPPPEQLHRLPIPEFFGLKAIDPLEILTRMQFPLIVSGFALIGMFLAWLIGRHRGGEGVMAQSLSLSLVIATVVTLSPGLVAIVLRLAPFLVQFVNFRSALILCMVLMPVVAGYGIWILAFSLLHPRLPIGLEGRPSLAKRSLPPVVASLAASLLALVIFGASVLPAGAFAANQEKTLSFGPTKLDLVDVWEVAEEGKEAPLGEQLAPKGWPAPTLRDFDPQISRSMQLASLLPADRPLRIDVSPYQGRLAMDLTVYGDLSQVNAYAYTTSLVHAAWGYQQNVYYSRETPANESGNPRTLNDLSQWFGTQYVFLKPEYDPVETYQQAGWQLVHEGGDLQVWRDPKAPPMATATTGPVVLIVSQPETDGYMTIFRLASNGMLPYQDALLVEGQARVDGYTLAELKPFDAVFLYGHDYRDSEEAWGTLAQYVSQGGSLFVETGWEFRIPEWEFEQSPEVLPIERLAWTDYGPATQFILGAPEIAGGVDVAKFKPLVWEGTPWMLSGAEAGDVRDWGQVVLSANGRPLIVAGSHGEGRVVWSGMNLIGHARYGETNAEELQLLGNLVRWLTGPGADFSLPTPVVQRANPDHLTISLAATPNQAFWLYWREAFYPNWHAYLVEDGRKRELPIYRGGPGFMLMPMETSRESVTVELRWTPSPVEHASVFVSGIGVLLLVALILDGLFLQGNGFTWFKIALVMRIPRPFLGEGSNREWAEKKRAELEAGLFAHDTPPHLEPRQAISWWKGEHSTEGAGRGGDGRAVSPNQQADGGDGRTGTPAAAPGRSGGPTSAPSGSTTADGRGVQPEPAIPTAAAIEPPSDGVERALLESWLNGSGHSDDAWAEKLLGRKNTAAES